jgi:hypothetical protein
MSGMIDLLSGMSDADKVATIAVAGVALTALACYLSSRRAIYINSVTVERSKWINALRENIAKITTDARMLNFKIAKNPNFKQTDDYLSSVNSTLGLMSLIRLQLNPEGPIDSNVLNLVRGLPIRAEKRDSTELIAYED